METRDFANYEFFSCLTATPPTSSRPMTRYHDYCMKRPHYHNGKPRKKWEKLGKAVRGAWCRPAVMLKEGDDMGNLRPNLQYLSDDGTWKESQVGNGKMTKLMVGVYRVILPNAERMDGGTPFHDAPCSILEERGDK
jgi:hypothetical protein